MNHHTTITPDTEAETDRVKAIAQAVLAGDTAGLPEITERELYGLDEWNTAALNAIECEDFSEFAWMMRREATYQDYLANERRTGSDDGDFDDYFAKAPGSSPVGMVKA